jgi:hypothetical protein
VNVDDGSGGGILAGIGILIWIIWLVVLLALGYWGSKIVTKKGYPAIVGWLLGFFVSCIGIIICFILPDKDN